MSRDHKRSLRVQDALVDPQVQTTCLPLSWLEQLRSPSRRLPTGYYVQELVTVSHPYANANSHYTDITGTALVKDDKQKIAKTTSFSQRKQIRQHHSSPPFSFSNTSVSSASNSFQPSSFSRTSCVHKNSASHNTQPNAVRAGPVVLYITGQLSPVVLNPYFVPDFLLRQGQQPMRSLPATSLPTLTNKAGQNDMNSRQTVKKRQQQIDLRLGLDAITQCTLFAELRPGGLLYHKLPSVQANQRFSSAQEILKQYGMKCGLAQSPLVPRPWTRMRYMFIDELQRGPKLTQFVGYNPREGSPWRFSQHNRYFRQGIWLDTIRRNEMNDGLHVHSSWQKSPQQSVPEISFLAPYP